MKSILLLPFLLLIGCGGPTKRCLVSPLSGKIVANGVPVEGAKVTRKYYSNWYADRVETVTVTDDKGHFAFEGAWKKALMNVPHQAVVHVEVIVENKGTNRTVLDLTKLSYANFGELQTVQDQDPERGKDRLKERDGKLYLEYDLELDKLPIGKPR